MSHIFTTLFCALMLIAPLITNAQSSEKSVVNVRIEEGWARATHAGQTVGAAYMTLISQQDSALVYVESEIAGSVEIHQMTMTKGVMKMRMLETLPLKANQPEKLAPGGFHLMLFDLKKSLKAGEKVTFTLCFKDKNNLITHQNVTLPIKEPN